MKVLEVVGLVFEILAGIIVIVGAIYGVMQWRRKRPITGIVHVKRDISEKEFYKGLKWLIEKIEEQFTPDFIIIISSGGATIGGIMSRHWNIPMAMSVRIEPKLQKTKPEESKILSFPPDEFIKGKKVLLIDDIVRRGSTLEEALRITNAAEPSQVKSAVLLLAGEHPPAYLDFYVYEADRRGIKIFYDYFSTNN
jgi:hypoxanthine phosphoribosyltransferase